MGFLVPMTVLEDTGLATGCIAGRLFSTIRHFFANETEKLSHLSRNKK
jgi:hypothetical protein